MLLANGTCKQVDSHRLAGDVHKNILAFLCYTKDMQVDLPRKTTDFLKAQLATGAYRNESEVITQALEMWQQITLLKQRQKLHAYLAQQPTVKPEDVEAYHQAVTRFHNSLAAQGVDGEVLLVQWLAHHD